MPIIAPATIPLQVNLVYKNFRKTESSGRPLMQTLNYRHLYYFWVAAKEGGAGHPQR